MKPSCSGQSLKPEDSPLGCGLVDEASCLSVLASTATLGPQSASAAPSCLPECGGHAAAPLRSPGAPSEPCRPSCPSLRSAVLCEAAESKPPARPGEVARLLSCRLSLQGFQAQLAKEIEAEETLGTPQRTGSTEWCCCFLYGPLFKPLKIILVGRKRIPDFFFAATSGLAGRGQKLARSPGFSHLGVSVGV